MRLRELMHKDAKGMLDWMQDRNINYWYCFYPENCSLQDAEHFISAQNNTTDIHRAIVDDRDIYLGTISLKNIDRKKREAEYAIVLRSIAQGRGVSSFATDEILKIAFDELLLDRVYLNVLSENERANRFYTKYGFTFLGVEKNKINHRGKQKDLNWYQLLRKENIWKKR